MPNRETIEPGSRSALCIVPLKEPSRVREGTSSLTRNTVADRARTWGASASTWVGSAVEALRRPTGDDQALHEFADVIADARDRDEINSALVALVYRISGARKVELFREAPSCSQRVASCSDLGGSAAGPEPIGDATEAEDGEDADALIVREPADSALSIPLRFAERSHGTLRLYPQAGQRWTPRLVRRIGTLCVMAAAAESGLLAAPRPAAKERVVIHDSAALGMILPYALAQAARHREPISLLCVEIDRLAAIRTLHGVGLVDDVLDLAARTIRGIVRTSDVVARLEDDRLIVLLPDAGGDDALRVAESLGAAIAGVAASSRALPALTASIGLASYPTHADRADSLVSAAFAAAAMARREGRNRVVLAPAADLALRLLDVP